MLALQAPRSTTAAKQLQQSHAGAFCISEWKQISLEKSGVIESRKDLECQQEERGSILLSVPRQWRAGEVLTQTHFSETDSSI